MGYWTLLYNGTEMSLADWGISQLRRRRASQSEDKISFNIARAYDADYLFIYDQYIEIWRDKTQVQGSSGALPTYTGGSRWFIGRITQLPVSGTARAEVQNYEATNAWLELEQLVFQQTWYTAIDPNNSNFNLAGGTQSRVTLFQGVNGLHMTIGDQLAEIVNWAISCGTYLQLGSHTLTAKPPLEEALDQTCAEAIRRVLRWAPDAVSWFDYTTTPPTINFARRSDCTAITYDMAVSKIEAITLGPRHDIALPGVVLKYERVSTIDGTAYRQVIRDIYPAGTTETQRGVLVSTIQLEGANIQHTYATIKCAGFNPTNLDWWKSKIPLLARPEVTILDWPSDLADILLYRVKIVKTSDNSDVDYRRVPYEVVEGQIAPWMTPGAGLDSGYTVKVTATFSYSVDSTRQFRQGNGGVISAPITGAQIFRNQPFSVTVTATGFPSGTYSTVAHASQAEPVPDGLAQQLYIAGTLQYDGSVTITDLEVPTSQPMGQVVNVTNGRSEWTSMRALVQTVDEDVDQGRAVIQVGPATHLGAGDLVEMLRANRGRRLVIDNTQRLTGVDGSAQDGGLGNVAANNYTLPGQYGVESEQNALTLYHPDSPLAINLDPTGLSQMGEAKTRWIRVNLQTSGQQTGQTVETIDAMVLAQVIQTV